jgi:penicillin V acylase-like amidase (Ntn superfamily)
MRKSRGTKTVTAFLSALMAMTAVSDAVACSRAVSDHKNKRYYYESTRSPNVFWVSLADMDFAPGKPVKKLLLTGGALYAGNAAAQFQPAAPFKFLDAPVK